MGLIKLIFVKFFLSVFTNWFTSLSVKCSLKNPYKSMFFAKAMPLAIAMEFLMLEIFPGTSFTNISLILSKFY